MVQSSNKIFDEMAKMMTDAAGAAQGFRREMETVMKTQMERILSSMDLVSREELEIAQAMAEKARNDYEILEKRVAALEKTFSNDSETKTNHNASKATSN
jgi:BMFP domain-containing protein YqiC